MTLFDTFTPQWPDLARRITPPPDVYAAIKYLRSQGCACERLGRIHCIRLKRKDQVRLLQDREVKQLARLMGWRAEA